MKRLATILMATAAAVACCGTVRMGALSTDTTVETLGESAATVQLVSKAKIDSMIEALSIGSDGTWLELNGSTGLIYQVVREVGVVGGRDAIVISATSGDGYNGASIGDTADDFYWDAPRRKIIGAYQINATRSIEGLNFRYIASFMPSSTKYNQAVHVGTKQFVSMATNNYAVSSLVFPQTLSAWTNSGAVGSLTLDWYGIKTNAYQIAITDDLPDLSAYATAGAVAAVQAEVAGKADAETVVSGAVGTASAGNRYFWTSATNVVLRVNLTGGQVVNLAKLNNTGATSITAIGAVGWEWTGGDMTNTIPAGKSMTFGFLVDAATGTTNAYATGVSK